jgi:group I intron endonuclease
MSKSCLPMIIYKATNLVNGKVYIGQTIKGLAKRRAEHLFWSSHGSGLYIHNAIRKYTDANFVWDVIDMCESRSELNIRECYWIKEYKSNDSSFGYNMTSGGDSPRGYKMSESAKKKIADSKRGKPRSEETKRKLSLSHMGIALGRKMPREAIEKRLQTMRGYRHSEETKRKIGLTSMGRSVGRKHTKEELAKMSLWQKGKGWSEERRKNWVVSEETRKKMSDSAKAARARRKLLHVYKDGEVA